MDSGLPWGLKENQCGVFTCKGISHHAHSRPTNQLVFTAGNPAGAYSGLNEWGEVGEIKGKKLGQRQGWVENDN